MSAHHCEGVVITILLQLQLMYVAMENRLSVHLIQAANVPVEGGLDGIDLFCKLQLQPEHRFILFFIYNFSFTTMQLQNYSVIIEDMV